MAGLFDRISNTFKGISEASKKSNIELQKLELEKQKARTEEAKVQSQILSNTAKDSLTQSQIQQTQALTKQTMTQDLGEQQSNLSKKIDNVEKISTPDSSSILDNISSLYGSRKEKVAPSIPNNMNDILSQTFGVNKGQDNLPRMKHNLAGIPLNENIVLPSFPGAESFSKAPYLEGEIPNKDSQVQQNIPVPGQQAPIPLNALPLSPEEAQIQAMRNKQIQEQGSPQTQLPQLAKLGQPIKSEPVQPLLSDAEISQSLPSSPQYQDIPVIHHDIHDALNQRARYADMLENTLPEYRKSREIIEAASDYRRQSVENTKRVKMHILAKQEQLAQNPPTFRRALSNLDFGQRAASLFHLLTTNPRYGNPGAVLESYVQEELHDLKQAHKAQEKFLDKADNLFSQFYEMTKDEFAAELATQEALHQNFMRMLGIQESLVTNEEQKIRLKALNQEENQKVALLQNQLTERIYENETNKSLKQLALKMNSRKFGAQFRLDQQKFDLQRQKFDLQKLAFNQRQMGMSYGGRSGVSGGRGGSSQEFSTNINYVNSLIKQGATFEQLRRSGISYGNLYRAGMPIEEFTRRGIDSNVVLQEAKEEENIEQKIIEHRKFASMTPGQMKAYEEKEYRKLERKANAVLRRAKRARRRLLSSESKVTQDRGSEIDNILKGNVSHEMGSPESSILDQTSRLHGSYTTTPSQDAKIDRIESILREKERKPSSGSQFILEDSRGRVKGKRGQRTGRGMTYNKIQNGQWLGDIGDKTTNRQAQEKIANAQTSLYTARTVDKALDRFGKFDPLLGWVSDMTGGYLFGGSSSDVKRVENELVDLALSRRITGTGGGNMSTQEQKYLKRYVELGEDGEVGLREWISKNQGRFDVITSAIGKKAVNDAYIQFQKDHYFRSLSKNEQLKIVGNRLQLTPREFRKYTREYRPF